MAGKAKVALLLNIFLLAGCGVPGPGGRADTYGLDFSLPKGAETNGAIIFYVDGLNAKIFQEMLDAGELPAFRKYFLERGLYAPRAVANIPSVTLANLTSFVTGRFPGHHGVTGVNYFDRNRLIWRNYDTIAQKNTLDGDYTAANIYEVFPDRTTFSVFFQPHRGATKFIENWTSAGPPFFFGWYEFVDRLTLSRFDIVMDVARKRREFPAVTIAYMLAPDFRAYASGVSSKEYRQAIRHTDRQIGRVLGDLQRAGMLDKVVIALVSDHGLIDVTKHFPLEQFLRDTVGLDVAREHLWEQTPFEQRLQYYQRYNCVMYGSGDRYAALCLRRPVVQGGKVIGYEPWMVRPDSSDIQNYPSRNIPEEGGKWRRRRPSDERGLNLLEMFTLHQAVRAVAYAAGPNRVRVLRQGGSIVEFRQPAGPGRPISYHLISGNDPLGWSGKVPPKALKGQPMTLRQWLEATAQTNFPDLPAQILAYFRAQRAGDIAVFAAEGWDFNTVNRAGHGGLGPGDMHVPLMLAGPGVPKGRLKTARTADVMPTLLKLLGRPVPPGLDGQSLLKAK